MLLAGVLLGLSAGLAPGPLLTLVAIQTLAHGTRHGARVAIAPLLSDAPIILLAVGLVGSLAIVDWVLPVLSLAGGCVVMFLAVEGVGAELPQPPRQSVTASLYRGVLVNLLNPQPWLFWFTLGAPMLVESQRAIGWSAPLVFILVFYGLLVGLKLLMAVVLGRYRGRLGAAWYRRVMRGLSVLLGAFALYLIGDGFLQLV